MASPAVQALDALIDELVCEQVILPTVPWWRRARAAHENRLRDLQILTLKRARLKVRIAEVQEVKDRRDKLRAEVERLKREGILHVQPRGCSVMGDK